MDVEPTFGTRPVGTILKGGGGVSGPGTVSRRASLVVLADEFLPATVSVDEEEEALALAGCGCACGGVSGRSELNVVDRARPMDKRGGEAGGVVTRDK